MMCHHQYLKDSVDQIVNFFESSAAVTQAVALETAAAVQVWLDYSFYMKWAAIDMFIIVI